MPQYVGSVYLDVRFDSTQASRDLSRTMGGAGTQAGATAGDAITRSLGAKLSGFGTKAASIGRQLSVGLSAPILALGVASERAFVAYDTNLTKVAALTGTGTAATQAMSAEVLNLASQYGVVGEDAANALYLITSSGIKGQDALDTLQVALGLAATGMGDAATTAGLLTSAINAYGEENLSASQAADILTGAVQESKIPADQLAGSISNLLPFGKQLGIGFDQITAAMAGLSLTGTNAAQAATQLRGIFNGLLDPSTQAAKALGKVGLSASHLKDTFSDEGILAGVREIRDAIVSHGGEADSELAEIFGNVRALTGVFALLNDEGGKLDRVFDNTTNSAGKFNAALRITQDSAGFKAKQAAADLHNEMIRLGETIAPIATAFLGIASGALEAVNSLGPLKYAIAGLGVVLSIAGPALFVVGSLARAIGAVTELFEGNAAAAGADAGATTALAAAQAELAAATEAVAIALGNVARAELLYGVGSAEAVAASEALAAAELEAAAAAEALTVAEGGATVGAGVMGAAITAAMGPVAAIVYGLAAAFVVWNKAMEVSQTHIDGLHDAVSNKINSGGIAQAQETANKLAKQINDAIAETKDDNAFQNATDIDYYKALDSAAQGAQVQIDAVNKEIDTARRLATKTGGEGDADKIFNFLAQERTAGRIYYDDATALAAYTKYVNEHGGAVSTAATATGKLAEKSEELNKAFFGAQDAQKKLDDALRKIEDSQLAVRDAQQGIIDAHKAEKDAVDKVADAQTKHRDALDKVTEAQKKLTEAQATLNEELRGPTADEQLDVKQAQLNVRKARKAITASGSDPLDRQQNRLDLQRAQAALLDAQGAHAKNLAKAQDDVAAAQKGVADAQSAALDAAKAITDAQDGVTTAHRNAERAERELDKAQRDLAQAQLDVAPAADALAQKQAELASTVADTNGGMGPLIGYLEELQKQYPAAAAALQVYIDKAKEIQAAYDAAHAPPPGSFEDQSPFGGGGDYGPLVRRAAGGPLSRGQASTVNELGLPELWTQGGKQYLMPLRAGRVTPLHEVDMPVRGGDGFSVGDINVYEVSGRPRQTAYEVRRELRKESFLSGRRP